MPYQQDTTKYAYHYAERLRFAIVPIPAGLKGPREEGWNKPENTVQNGAQAREVFGKRPLNMGVLHSASDTGTLDVDNQDWAEMALAAIGLNLKDLQNVPLKIKGKNGMKPFFQMGGRDYKRRSVAWPHPTAKQKDKDGNPTDKPVMVTLFELRAGPVQDVLPPSIHPDTQRPYEWVGTPPRSRADIPMIPDELVHLWENWDELAERMKAACPWNDVLPAAPQKTYVAGNSASVKGERPGDHFKARVHISTVLLRNGYQQVGGRFLPPGSKSAAGVRLITGEDGLERAYSDHGSCALNNGHTHDSFSALVILEHGGDVRAAARSAAQELGLELPAAPPQATLKGDPTQLWAEHGSAVCDTFMDALSAARGHQKSKQKYMDILLAIFAAVEEGCLKVRNGQPIVEFGGLALLAERMLYRGRLLDLSSGLDYLASIGMLGRVVSTNPSDRFAPLAVEVTADPRDLPFMTFQGRIELRSSSYTTRRRLLPQTKKTNMDTKGESQVGHNIKERKSTAVVSNLRRATPLHDARFVLYWIRRGARSAQQVAKLGRMRLVTVQKHLKNLEAAGLLVDFTLVVSKSESDVLVRLEVESDPAYRKARMRYLQGTYSFASWGAGVADQVNAPRMKARRLATQSRAHERLNRLMDGESCGAVLLGVA